jgi:hypothetical protein
MIDYITIKEAADHWGISPRRIQILCNENRIDGAIKFGRDWAIPSTSQKPKDMRVTSGEYINWRKGRSGRMERLAEEAVG